MIADLSAKLCQITGYDAMSMQPNSGAQGEYAGLMTIRAWHRSRGEAAPRHLPDPDDRAWHQPGLGPYGRAEGGGEIGRERRYRLDDFRAKAEAARRRLAACMITYPSTHGVFEETVREVCEITHAFGGQVYLDGANLNALVGIAKPGDLGRRCQPPEPAQDLLHPAWRRRARHGPDRGQGASRPVPAGHPLRRRRGGGGGGRAVRLASILPISWAYVLMMGGEGLTQATKVAILNANYIAKRLEGAFDVLYTGRNGRVAHECIIDTRPFAEAPGSAWTTSPSG
jgi:glycine dehydrogenase